MKIEISNESMSILFLLIGLALSVVFFASLVSAYGRYLHDRLWHSKSITLLRKFREDCVNGKRESAIDELEVSIEPLLLEIDRQRTGRL